MLCHIYVDEINNNNNNIIIIIIIIMLCLNLFNTLF